jgi:hypothetical protein
MKKRENEMHFSDSEIARAGHSGKTPGNNFFFENFFLFFILIFLMYGVTLQLIAKIWNFGSNFQKLVYGKVLFPKTFFSFFPILAVIFHFFGLDSKSVHSPAHPYTIHRWKHLILYFSIN